MTGTSIDALDAALVRVHGGGLEMRPEFVRGVSRPLGDLAPRLRRLAEQVPTTAGAIAALARDFALLHADAVRNLLSQAGLGSGDVSLVSVHGQTVFHQPPVSWQLFSAPVLAHALGIPVVTDLRGADLAAGGQGAPITPLADWVFFRSGTPTAIVNLGGFCNITLLPGAADDHAASPEGVRGFDLCACNHVLDTLARELLGKPFDAGGRTALGGTPDPEAVHAIHAMLERQSRSGRSLGTGDELMAFIDAWRRRGTPADLCAAACAAIGSLIGHACRDHPRVLLAGGGTRNAALARAIGAACGARVSTTDDAGLPAEFREAAHMGVLGTLCADGVPITLPAVTRTPDPAPIAGVWAGLANPAVHARERTA